MRARVFWLMIPIAAFAITAPVSGTSAIAPQHPIAIVIHGAIEVMEDSPLFNVGKGAVFTHDGKNE
jgi:isoaspartyl peptidase/L-asparaginase-like protein (Ntn-hydrolase superfamily)